MLNVDFTAAKDLGWLVLRHVSTVKKSTRNCVFRYDIIYDYDYYYMLLAIADRDQTSFMNKNLSKFGHNGTLVRSTAQISYSSHGRLTLG
jgi:hypothetical protein